MNKKTLMTVNLVLTNLIENTVLGNEIIIFMSAMSNKSINCELISLLSIRGWWVRYVTMWDTTLQQLFDEVSMLKSCIDED